MDKTIYDLELHEVLEINCMMSVLRVAGGWVYQSYNAQADGYFQEATVFVPYNNEFEGNDMDKTKPCPCGEKHPKLIITDAGQGQKYALACGHCCGEWCIEFRTNYKSFDSDECMELAIDAWNQTPRKDSAQAEIDELVEILNLYITRDGDDVYPWTNKAKELTKHKGE